MSNLEEDLKMALRRGEPPADFTDRVLARLSQPPEPSWRERLSVLMRPPRLQWVAITVMVSVLLPTAALQYHKEQQYQAEGERAKQQLLFAVRIAGSRLHQAQKKVLEGGRMDTRL
jgi:hypothetical protein